MNEAVFRREIYQMLRYRYALWPHHIPDVVGSKRPGVPDLIVMNPSGPGIYIEAKYIDTYDETSFAFAAIEESQRRWLFDWEKVRRGGSYLAIGASANERRLYIIPWLEWLYIEAIVSPFQLSLPYKAGQGYRTELQEQGLDFRLLSKWKCKRVKRNARLKGESGWLLPDDIRWSVSNE